MAKTIKKDTLHAVGFQIGIYTTDFENEFISLTDIAKYRSIQPSITIHNWLRGRDTVDFLGLWESLHNPDFKLIEFDKFKINAGTNAFVFSIKDWTEKLGGIGLLTKSGRYGGGIYAHVDIAFEFASWISPEFKLYIIKDYQRLKHDENSQLSPKWNLNREVAKINYKIHTDAIKNHLIPPELTKAQMSFVYADEADMLNVVLFGETAKEWRIKNPNTKGNMRDNASIQQLLVLANMESYNAILITQGLNQPERMQKLRELAIQQLKTLNDLETHSLPKLPEQQSNEE